MSEHDLLDHYLSQLKQLDAKERITVIMQIAAMGGKDIAAELVQLLKDEQEQLHTSAMQIVEALAASTGAKALRMWQRTQQDGALNSTLDGLQINDKQLKTIAILQLIEATESNVAATLLTRLTEETDTEIRKTILYALRMRGNLTIIPQLYPIIQSDEDAMIRNRALSVLQYFATVDNLTALIDALRDADEPSQKIAYSYALGWTQSVAAIPHLLDTLSPSSSSAQQQEVINALLKIGTSAMPRLIQTLDYETPMRQAVAAWVLGYLDQAGHSVQHLIPLLDHHEDITFFTGDHYLDDVVAQALRSINTQDARRATWLWEHDDS